MKSHMAMLMQKRAKELLASGDVRLVLGWKAGDIPCYPEPAFFADDKALDEFVYDRFCSANLSKYMLESEARKGKTLVFLRPCDTYGYNQLLKENQVNRDHAYIIGVGCEGCVGLDEGEETGLLEGCVVCTKTSHKIYDELICEDVAPRETTDKNARFNDVSRLEESDSKDRYEFWRGNLARCIRCNACRNICPTCHCRKCVFDNDQYDTKQKVNATPYEGKMFHIIRALHVAGRCSDCGQCSRVCPTGIPLHLLNRKLIKDINELYGEFQAGDDIEIPSPLTDFNIENDPEPPSIHKKGVR